MLQVGFEPNPMHKEVLDSTVSALRDSLSTEFDIICLNYFFIHNVIYKLDFCKVLSQGSNSYGN